MNDYEKKLRENLPEEMQASKRWLLWKSRPNGKNKKPRKVPYYASGVPRSGQLDGPEDTAKLATFYEALAAYEASSYAGLGIALGPEGGEYLQGIDIDDAHDHKELKQVCASIGGYIELSPSGKGLHYYGIGRSFKSLASNTTGIEAYSGSRFFTVTGDKVFDSGISCLAGAVETGLVPLHSPGRAVSKPPRKNHSPRVKMLAGGGGFPLSDANKMADECPALGEMRANNGAGQSEPFWHAEINLLAQAKNGEKVSHDWSSGYKGYDRNECQKKIDKAKKFGKPTTCARFGELTDLCEDCKYGGKLTTPLTLGLSKKALDEYTVMLTEKNMSGLGGDITNGKYFAIVNRGKMVFVPELGGWLVFDESAGWIIAPYGEAERAAKAIIQRMRERAAELYKEEPEGSRTKRLMAHIERSSKMPKIRDMIDAAKSEPGMTKSLNDFDADPMQLGLGNGVWDLQKGRLLPISPECLVTKRCSVSYDAAETCPEFDKYFAEVQPDSAIRGFLQRFAGYLLTGSVDEQVFVFFYGLGANGKSVFIELLAWLMGDYSRKIPTEMLMQHQRSPQGPSPDIVALKGIRVAHANETDEGRRLAEARVKEMTGGDTLTGRVPYAKADITFQPTHKIIIVGNHKPEIADTSNGMWRRVLLINWDTTIPDNRQDKQLLEKLKTEGPGILNWALQGCRQWKQNGLQVPEQIRAATEEYRDEQDIIGEWLAEDCNMGFGRTEEKKRLYIAYQRWTRINGHYPLAQGRLTRRLNERGYKLQRDKRTVAGLALKPEIRGLCS